MPYVIPPRPESFTPQGVAPGCQRVPNLYHRDLSTRRMDVLVVHTNWANNPATIQSAINWAKAAPGKNTYAHYQHELGGNAAKLLDTNRRGIGNGGTSSYWAEYGLPTASHRALVFETADRGQLADPPPTGSWFTDAEAASLCRDLAYECIVHDIPPVLLPRPDGRGIVAHTWPFPYPAFTTASGKKCPGYRKIEQLTDLIIPWTAAIVDAWKNPPPPPVVTPPEEDEVTDDDVRRIAEAVRDLNIPGTTINYPVPAGGAPADFWSVVVDTRARVVALAEQVAELAAELDAAK